MDDQNYSLDDNFHINENNSGGQNSKNKLRHRKTEKQKTSLPTADCPGCDNSIYPLEITFACEKCSEIYHVPSNLLENQIHFCKTDSEKTKKYLIEYSNRRKVIDMNLNDALDRDEDNKKKYDVSFGGDVLDILKQIKKTYGFKNLGMVIHFVFQVFMLTLKELRTLPGTKVYLVDDLGNKSKEIKQTVLGKTYDAFNKEQDSYVVERFLDDINVLFKVDEVKNKISFFDKEE